MADSPTSRPFRIGERKLKFLRAVEQKLRELVNAPHLEPEDLVGLARAIRCLQRAPQCSPGVSVFIQVKYESSETVSLADLTCASDEISAHYGYAAILGPGEYESGPHFAMSVGVDRRAEWEGSSEDYLNELAAPSKSDDPRYSVEISDSSTPDGVLPEAPDI